MFVDGLVQLTVILRVVKAPALANGVVEAAGGVLTVNIFDKADCVVKPNRVACASTCMV